MSWIYADETCDDFRDSPRLRLLEPLDSEVLYLTIQPTRYLGVWLTAAVGRLRPCTGRFLTMDLIFSVNRLAWAGDF